MKSITIYGIHGTNPPKVIIVLAELGLPYEIIPTPLSEVKSEWYTALNPNGRLPTIVDPNTNTTVWETGAIIEYLTETYDKERKISFEPGSTEYFQAKQWLFFQVSGQGPYYGQATWFQKFHDEKIPSAIERYKNEVHRVTGVLEGWLQGRTWLVGEKCSYADLSFFVYQALATTTTSEKPGAYPMVDAWVARMRERQSVQKMMKEIGKEI